MNKTEKIIFKMLFAILALFFLFSLIIFCKAIIAPIIVIQNDWMLTIIVFLTLFLFLLAFLLWAIYAFTGAWTEINDMCEKKHKKTK